MSAKAGKTEETSTWNGRYDMTSLENTPHQRVFQYSGNNFDLAEVFHTLTQNASSRGDWGRGAVERLRQLTAARAVSRRVLHWWGQQTREAAHGTHHKDRSAGV